MLEATSCFSVIEKKNSTNTCIRAPLSLLKQREPKSSNDKPINRHCGVFLWDIFCRNS